jgi:RNA polymerase sigma factor (sigma-70 family)
VIEGEALVELVKALPKTRDLIIEEHMKLARSIGVWYARRHRRLPDDLISAANLGLVQAVQWACQGRLRDHNITPYIVVTIHRYCREAIEADHTVVVARKARRHYVATKGLPVSKEIVDEHAIDDHPDKRILYAELMETFCVRHRVVIELRLAGYTQVEISEKLNVSQPMVHKYLKEIKERLSNLSDIALHLRSLI